jgi:diguanylate cyclase (GGDEF)-like protein
MGNLVSYHSHKQKIIIADTTLADAKRVQSKLLQKGFSDFEFATSNEEIYKIIIENRPIIDDIILLIANDNLPDIHYNQLIPSLFHPNGDFNIPLLILKSPEKFDLIDQYFENCSLAYTLTNDCSTTELQITLEFLIKLKSEYDLRQKQQKQLSAELAERKIIDAKLKYLVNHDELTGLYNRAHLEQSIRLSLNKHYKQDLKQDSFLLFIDLDRFSLINELEGFNVGDRLLTETIIIIRKSLSNRGLFARIGSDEFCLYLENFPATEARSISEAIRKALDSFRFISGEATYSITASIGIGSVKSLPTTLHPHELISLARQACCMAKANGRNMIWEFNSTDYFIKERHRDLFWAPVIRDALINNDFYLVFQPVVNLSDGAISHYEVLIRLRGITGLEINPSEFIMAGERMGLIHGIDIWVIEKAIEFLAELPAEFSDVSLAINLSGLAFLNEALLPFIKQKLELSWVRAERITFEITETAAVDNFETSRNTINQIRALGCRFALDDFGAGFCSFNYLKKFPVDYVKIDGQFIQNITSNQTDRLLVKAMHDIARELGKKTIAEFVETAETLQILREIGITYGQGQYFGMPSPTILKHGVFKFESPIAQSDDKM